MVRIIIVCIIVVPSLMSMTADKSAEQQPAHPTQVQDVVSILFEAIKNKEYETYFNYIEKFEPRLRSCLYNLPINYPDETALHYAIGTGAGVKVIERMLACGADLHARTRKGWTPLHVAAEQNNKETIECLLSFVPIESRYYVTEAATFDLGTTPLHHAAAFDREDALECLLNAGAFMETRSHTGDTPLHLAAFHDSSGTFFCLLKRGANLLARNSSSQTPLDIAKRNVLACQEMIPMLKKIQNDKNSDAPNQLSVQVYDGFLGSILNTANRGKGTLLMRAAYAGIVPIVRELLEDNRTDVTLKGFQGNTALHFAAEKGHKAVVLLFLSNKKEPEIKINKQNDDGETALHLAAKNGHAMVVELLLDDPTIDVNVKNNRGLKALQLADANKRTEGA